MRQSRSLAEHLALLDARQEVESETESDIDSELGNQAPNAALNAEAPTPTIGFSSRPLAVAIDPENVNERLGGINPSIRTLTAIPPSIAKASAAAAAQNQPGAVSEVAALPTTLATVAVPQALSRRPQLPSIADTQPTEVVQAVPTIEEGITPAQTGAPSISTILPEEEVAGEEPGGSATSAEGVIGMEGMEGAEGGALGLGEKESEVILPDNNRGVAIGITFGVLALMAVLMLAGFAFVKWRKKKNDSFYDRPPPPGIKRGTMPPPPPAKSQ